MDLNPWSGKLTGTLVKPLMLRLLPLGPYEESCLRKFHRFRRGSGCEDCRRSRRYNGDAREICLSSTVAPLAVLVDTDYCRKMSCKLLTIKEFKERYPSEKIPKDLQNLLQEMANNQFVRRHLNAFTRGRIIGKLEKGRSVTSVADEFGIALSIVSRLWRQFQTTGTAIRGLSSGRPRGTTPADDRYIVLQARRNRWQTAGEIARHTTQATGRPISRFTVARRLHGDGLFARRPVRDESRFSLSSDSHRRFSLSSDSHRIFIWRERGSRNHPSNIIERDRYGGRGVLVWGGIMLGSRTDLHIFDAGSVNGTRYCNEILFPYVRLFRSTMGLQFLFMDDNAPCHRTVAAEQLLESEGIERMDWPARSPDLNPIEHVWDFLGRRLAARTLPPVTIRELRLALNDEWAAMPQQLIDILILSMGRRC
ncbi:transposable element Tc1 transposase [Trichonephila clavipes]|nr:transposable element Tc1 transposase [Trichonephila clavipes]